MTTETTSARANIALAKGMENSLERQGPQRMVSTGI